ncbi:histidine phosphatase family protein [Amycolatopsis orientalis]|uniref:histidine phosphatase family protein n=1 Tax=Amycolatopsis orientalis TaxID=31958 RepID=UPI0004252891|nr:histidine phosphatase family protein [Amycolatopsis orientalis]
MVARLLLVRHGQTEWHAENRYAGSSDVALTEEGLRQAEELAGFAVAAGPSSVFCSPQSRARRTAEPSAEALGLPLRVIDELREVHFGLMEGRTRDELAATDPDAVARFLADPVTGAFPGSEPPGDAAARGAKALRGIAAEVPGETVLVVAHNTLIRLTLCELLGIPLETYRTVFPRLDNAAVTEIAIDGTRTGLLRLNQPARTRYWTP